MNADGAEGMQPPTAPAGDTSVAEAEAARFRRADALLDAALDRPAGEREAFVRAACADDPTLAAHLQRLLAAHDDATGRQFLAAPAARLMAAFGAGAALTAGERLGRYRLVRPVGRGGMGTVWLARDDTLERDVAIKIVHDVVVGGAGGATTPGSGAGTGSRAVREARVVARLDHPHVAGIYDVGETPDGALWLAMPYLPGGSLADRLRAGPMPWIEAVRLGRQLASALAAAHAQGIVHRDVKPANVLLDAGGNVRLADFGIAKLPNATLQSQLVMGTIGYAAPEQLGEGPVDAKADLWALGVTLYELLAGRRPFEGDTPLAMVGAILHSPPRPLPADRGIPAALEALVAQLLTKEPDGRPTSARDVEAALAAIGADPSTEPPARASAATGGATAPARTATRPPAPPPGAPRAAARGTRLMATTLVLALVAAVAWITRERLRSPSPVVAGPDTAARASTLPGETRPDLASVAVLPFTSLAGGTADEPFADGLTDEVIGALGRYEELRVASRTAAFAFRDRRLGPRALGDSLGVAHLLEAGVRRDGRRLRVTARLVRVSDGRIVWSRDYDRDVRDVFAVQAELAGAIAVALAPRLATSAPSPANLQVPAGTTNLEAYDLYLRGRWLLAQRSRAALDEGVGAFERALALDPRFARAWVALADARLLRVVFAGARPADEIPRARREAERALGIDSLLGAAHGTLSHLLRTYEYDWRRSAAEGGRAVTLEPHDVLVRVSYALTLLHSGRAAEALRVLAPAREEHSRDAGVWVTLGRAQLATGEVDSAVASLRRATQLLPRLSFAHQSLGYALLAQGRPADALTAFRDAAALGAPTDSAHLAWALATQGDTAQARTIVRGLEAGGHADWTVAVGLAVANEGLGEREAAFAWLERAWRERAPYLDSVGILPSLRGLRQDARWPAFAAKLGLRD